MTAMTRRRMRVAFVSLPPDERSATSTSAHYESGTSTHLQVNLDDNTSVTTPWKVRLLSAEGTPSSNVSVSKNGTFHFWFKTSNAVSGATLQIYMDDSDGTEGSATIAVINDGAWHEYKWNLSTWSGVNVSGGNGQLDAANVTLDAIVLNSPNRTGRWTSSRPGG